MPLLVCKHESYQLFTGSPVRFHVEDDARILGKGQTGRNVWNR